MTTDSYLLTHILFSHVSYEYVYHVYGNPRRTCWPWPFKIRNYSTGVFYYVVCKCTFWIEMM